MTTNATRLTTAFAASAITLAGFAPSAVSAGTMQTNQHDFIHRNIAQESAYDSVVKMNISTGASGANNGAGQFIASGVVIGGRYLLTAAHNIDNATNIDVEIRGKNYRGSRWVAHVGHYNWSFADVNKDQASDDYNPFPALLSRGFEEGNDIAIVELAERIPKAGTIAAKLSRNVNQANGKTGTIVGFGAPGNGTDGIDNLVGGDDISTAPRFLGTKRAGYNKIDRLNRNIGGQLSVDFDVAPTNPIFNSIQNPKYNPFTGRVDGITRDDIPLAQEYMPAVGDSGGGLFVNGNTLAGITSWSSRANSEYFSQAYFTTVAKHYAWIRANIQALKGLRDFRGNLKVWQEIQPSTTPPRFFKVRDFGSTGFSLLGERAARGGPANNGDNDPGDVYGIITDDPGRFPGRLNGAYITPEPASLALLSLGGLAMLRRTRR